MSKKRKQLGTRAAPSNQPLKFTGKALKFKNAQERRDKARKDQEERERRVLERRRVKAKDGLKKLLETPSEREAFYDLHPWLRPKKEVVVRHYLVPKGIPCSVAPDGSEEWKPHVTKSEHTYERYQRYVEQGNASFFEFQRGNWKMLVSCRRVNIREE